jgi:hypothetical protein
MRESQQLEKWEAMAEAICATEPENTAGALYCFGTMAAHMPREITDGNLLY